MNHGGLHVLLLCWMLLLSDAVLSIAPISYDTAIGYDATLTCQMTAITASSTTIVWTTPTGDVHEGSGVTGYTVTNTNVAGAAQTSTLTIDKLLVTADRSYTCKVTDSGVETTAAVSLKTFDISVATKEVKVGNSATMTCTLSEITVADRTFKWKKGSVTYTAATNSGHSTHQVTDVSATITKLTVAAGSVTGDGIFTCIVTVQSKEYEELSSLKTFTVTPVSKEILKGSTLSIFCQISGTSASSYAVTWIGGGTVVTKASSDSAAVVTDSAINANKAESKLVITANADATWTCQVAVDGGTGYDTTVSVNIFDVTVTNKEVLVGTSATLSCMATSLATPLTSVSWKGLSSTEYSISNTATGFTVTNGNFDTNKQTVTLTIAAAQNTGDVAYSCALGVEGGQVGEKPAPLKTFTMSGATKEVRIGYESVLTCSIQGLTVMSSSVVWGDESITFSNANAGNADNTGFVVAAGTNGQATRTTTLTISAAKVTGDREYTCKIQVDGTWFKKTISTKTFDVVPDSVIEYQTGKPATLSCQVNGLAGSVVLSWAKGGGSYNSPSTAQGYTVTAPSATSTKLVIGSTGAGVSLVTQDETWTCVAVVESATYKTNVLLKTFVLTPTSADVLTGQDAVLTCVASDLSVSSLGVRWTDGTTVWTQSSSTTGGYTVTQGSINSNGIMTTTLTIDGRWTGGDKMFTCGIDNGGTWNNADVQMKIFAIEMTPTEVRNSTAATLTCTVKWASVTPSAMTWSIQGDSTVYSKDSSSSAHTVVYSSGSFVAATGTVKSTIVTNNPQADKHYTCNVVYAGKTFYGPTTLSVFGIHTQDEAVYAGQNATLTCQIDGYTTVITNDQVKWNSASGENITNGMTYNQAQGKLTLALTNIQFDAEYTCSVWADKQWHTRTQKVDVFSIDAIPDLNVVGDQATPYCKIVNMNKLANSVVTVSWSDGTNAVTAGLSKSSGGFEGDTLTVTVSTDTTYTCSVNVDLYFGVKSFTKQVFLDAVEISHPNVVQTQGSSETLQCTITNINREAYATTSWTTVPNSIRSPADYKAVLTQFTNNSHIFVSEITAVDKAKTEGKWVCNFVYPRYSSPSMTRTINRIVYLDVTEWTTIPVIQYKAKDSTAVYTCKGRSTTALNGAGINPTYTWTVNGVDRTSDSSVSNKLSTLSITALYVLDQKTVICTTKWTSSPSTIHHSMSTDTLLYSKYIAVYPNSVVYAEVGGELKMTCVVNTIYNSVASGTTLDWFKGASNTSINTTDDTNKLITNTTASSDNNTETSVLTIKVVSDADVAKYECVWDYTEATAADRQTVIDFKNALNISTQPVVNSVAVKSGYTSTYTVNAEKDAAFPEMTYVWYKNGAAFQTEKNASTIAINTGRTGQVMYRDDKDNKYKVQITWHGTYQTISLMSAEAAIAIIDTCRVEYNTLNSQTKVDNTKQYVVHGTNILSTCDKGYILPKANGGVAMSYTSTCKTNVSIPVIDTQVNFTNCEGGNYINDAPTNNAFTINDNAKLVLSGFTTVHKGTVASVTCSTGYTLRKIWSSTTTCNNANAAQCTFDGLCVTGCEYTKNSHTNTSYVTPHNTTLLANLDVFHYNCNPHTFTDHGLNHANSTCDMGQMMHLNACNPVVFGEPTSVRRVTTMKLTWMKPTYPSHAPSHYTVTIYNADKSHYQTEQTSELKLSFSKLKNSTTYYFDITMMYRGGLSDVKTFSYKTADDVIAADATVKKVSMEVPIVDYVVEKYEVVVIYISNDYIGKRSNFVYKYTNYIQNAHKWSRDKRDTLETVVWIYPSADDLFDSEENMGAWIGRTAKPSELNGTRLSFDARAIYLQDNAEYYCITRVCKPDSTECVYGDESIIDMPKDWRIVIILGVLIPLVVIVMVVLIYILYKGPMKGKNKKSMDHEHGTYKNEAYQKNKDSSSSSSSN